MVLLLQLAAAFLSIIAVTLVVYLKWTFSYWSRRKVYVNPPTLPFGNASKQFLGKESIAIALKKFYNELRARGLRYGGYHFFFQPMFVPADLNLIKHILLLDFQHFTDHPSYLNETADPLSGHLFGLKGAKWKAVRAKLTPLFSSGKLKIMFKTLVDCTSDLPIIFNKSASSGEPINIKDTFARYTTDVIGSIAFGIECNCLKIPNNEFRDYGRKAIEVEGIDGLRQVLGLLMPILFVKLNIPLTRKDVEKFFMKIVEETINYREKNNVERKDFLQLLLKLRNEEIKIESSGSQDDNENKVLYYQNGLSIQEIAAHCFVFFLAGFETSATTLNFFMYELSTHSDIQDKLRKEINEVLAKHDGKITYEAIQEMTYLDRCMYETLRKYPPVPIVPRECTKDYKVPDSDLVIRKGTAVAIPVLGIHHDPEIYPDPEEFDPDRFTDENKRSRSPVSFLAFGEGPRICIGLRLGLLQTKVGLVAMLKNYKFSLNSKTHQPLQYGTQQIILTALGGVWLNVEKI